MLRVSFVSEVIKRGYQERCEEFNAFHRINNSDEVDNLVIGELMKIYSKSVSVIKGIVGID